MIESVYDGNNYAITATVAVAAAAEDDDDDDAVVVDEALCRGRVYALARSIVPRITCVSILLMKNNSRPPLFPVILPERDYVTFRSLLSQIRLSSVTPVRPTHGVEIFGNISSPFCTLAIL